MGKQERKVGRPRCTNVRLVRKLWSNGTSPKQSTKTEQKNDVSGIKVKQVVRQSMGWFRSLRRYVKWRRPWQLLRLNQRSIRQCLRIAKGTWVWMAVSWAVVESSVRALGSILRHLLRLFRTCSIREIYLHQTSPS